MLNKRATCITNILHCSLVHSIIPLFSLHHSSSCCHFFMVKAVRQQTSMDGGNFNDPLVGRHFFLVSKLLHAWFYCLFSLPILEEVLQTLCREKKNYNKCPVSFLVFHLKRKDRRQTTATNERGSSDRDEKAHFWFFYLLPYTFYFFFTLRKKEQFLLM